jgi:serine/threonine-protein kinase
VISPERHQRVEELFDRLADEPPSEQHRLLREACGDDHELEAHVAALLEADHDGHPLLHADAAALASELLDAGGATALPGRLGRYVLKEHLGEGGMGSVYLAERSDLGDLVALKFLHDAWSSPARRWRFAREQITLASLNHRYIARLYDAGITKGTPWFAMEYVPGTSIVEYCRTHVPDLRGRLQLFRAVCEAVGYAHRNLTVHLDLKPSNILVNADGEVRLVDFGIARHLTGQGGEAEKTVTANHFLSLNYAAPEQIRGKAVDVQADVYALGVILYELLAGRLPMNLADARPADLLRLINEEPQKPSTAARGGDASAVRASKSEWKDLDVLCLTALRREKAERYQTVDRLVSDLDRFLGNEPLDAHADSLWWYRLRKFAARNRRPVIATAAILAVVTALIVFFNVRLIDARDRAVSSEARMQQIHRLMLNLFEGDDTAAGPAEQLRVASLLDRGVHEADSLNSQPDLQAELRYTFGGLYYKLGHLDRAEPLLAAALNYRRSALGREDPQTIRAQLALAVLRVDQSRLDEAEQLVRESLDIARRRPTVYRVEVATTGAALGKVLAARGDYTAAVPLLKDAVAELSKLPPSAELSEAYGDLANTEYYLGHVDESEAVSTESLEFDRRLFGERHPHVAVDLYNLANIQLDRGNYPRAEELFRNALAINDAWYGEKHPKTAANVLMIGRSLAYEGRLQEAGAMYDRAIVVFRAAFGERHFRVGSVLTLQGDLAREQGDLVRAESLFRQAAAVFESIVGTEHEFYLFQLSNLGTLLLAKGEYAKAEPMLRNALQRLTAAAPDTRYAALAQVRLGAALAALKRYPEAERETLAGYRLLQRVTGAASAEQRDARRDLVAIYTALNEPEKANEFR